MKREPNVAPPKTAVKQRRCVSNRPRKLLVWLVPIKPPTCQFQSKFGPFRAERKKRKPPLSGCKVTRGAAGLSRSGRGFPANTLCIFLPFSDCPVLSSSALPVPAGYYILKTVPLRRFLSPLCALDSNYHITLVSVTG